MKRPLFLILSALAAVALAGLAACAGAGQENIEEGSQKMTLIITSTAFKDGETVPKKHTCDGSNVSPALAWNGIPAGAKSLALIADDPDAPMGVWVHWVLYDLPAETKSLAEGSQGVGVQGKNDFRKTGYGGPCPPAGKPHRYFFKLYALDASLGLKPGAAKAEVEKAMQGHILAQGQLVGKYGR